jgi:hypothetical protein
MRILHRGFERSRQALGHTSGLLQINTPTPTFIQKSGVRGGADGDGSFYGSEANSPCLSLLPVICTIPRQDRRSRVWRSHGIVLILERNTKILQKGVRVCGRTYWAGLVNSYGVVLRLDSCFILSSQTIPIPYLPRSICGIRVISFTSP